MSFFGQYFSFLLDTVTIVVAILIIFLGLVTIAARGKVKSKGRLIIQSLNEKLAKTKLECLTHMGTKAEKKAFKQSQKAFKKAKDPARLFLIRFEGDIMASGTTGLIEEVNAVLQIADPEKDEVVVSVESGGGVVHGYGLAASQLARIRSRNIPLTVSVDKVAASGGYMMAAVANKIIAAPFAILGSVGVLAQVPNFNRFLDKHGVDFEQFTAGQYKRTVTMFGKNTDEDREKFKSELEDVHGLFKKFVSEYRPQVDIDQIATGEHWYGEQAMEHRLLDNIETLDDYLSKAHHDQRAVYELSFKEKRSFSQRVKLIKAQLGI